MTTPKEVIAKAFVGYSERVRAIINPSAIPTATIADAPPFLNTNDKAMWVTGWNDCVAKLEQLNKGTA